MSSESTTFDAPVVLEFVKTYISDGADPHLWIAGAVNVPVPDGVEAFELKEDDIQVFYGLNILSEPELHAEYVKFRNQQKQQVITEDPYKAIPSPRVEEQEQSDTGGNAGSSSRGARVLQEAQERDSLDQAEIDKLAKFAPVELAMMKDAGLVHVKKTPEQLSYLEWLEQAVKSGEFDYIGHDRSLYNRFFSPSLAIILNNYEKTGGGDPAVDELKMRIAQADLTIPNTEYIYQGSKIWTRTGERLVGELQQALNSFYFQKGLKLLKYDLRNLEKGAASYQKLPQPGSALWTSFISNISGGNQTHLEARLHKLKADAKTAQKPVGSYFKRQRTPRIQQLAVKLGLD